MKFNKQTCFFIVFFALGLLVNLTALERSRTVNLVENSSFEVDDDRDGLPDCWCLISNYLNDYYLDSEEELFGDVSLRMETYCNPSSAGIIYKVGSGGACLWRDVEPNTTYTLSYYIKTDRPDSVLALPNAWEYDADGNLVDQHYEYLSLNPGWQRVVYTFTTHPNAGEVKLWLCVRVWAFYAQAVTGLQEGEFYTSWIDGVQLEESDSPSAFHTTFGSCPGILQSQVDIYPNTLNLKSKGKWVTCFIELPEEYENLKIDASTVMLNDVISAELKHAKIGDYDHDHKADLKIKFSRKDIISYLRSKGIKQSDEVELTVGGLLEDGTSFEGRDIVRIRHE